eukprot:394922_1
MSTLVVQHPSNGPKCSSFSPLTYSRDQLLTLFKAPTKPLYLDNFGAIVSDILLKPVASYGLSTDEKRLRSNGIFRNNFSNYRPVLNRQTGVARRNQDSRFPDKPPAASRFPDKPPTAGRFPDKPPTAGRFPDKPPAAGRFLDKPPAAGRFPDKPPATATQRERGRKSDSNSKPADASPLGPSKSESQDSKSESRRDSKTETRRISKQNARQTSKQDVRQESKQDVRQTPKHDVRQTPKHDVRQTPKHDARQTSKQDVRQTPKHDVRQTSKQDVRFEKPGSPTDLPNGSPKWEPKDKANDHKFKQKPADSKKSKNDSKKSAD